MTNRYKLSVITSSNRGPDYIEQLMRDMRNQTLDKNLWEHVIVFDGLPKDGVEDVIKFHAKDYHVTAYNIFRNPSDLPHGYGISPKNHGTSTCRGDYVCYADDDDRYRDTYLASLLLGSHDNHINCVQMSCTDYKMCGGSKEHSVLVPEIESVFIPRPCHFGTPCLIYRKEWALDNPYLNCSDNDYIFARTIVHRYRPTISLVTGWHVDPDAHHVGSLKDWVSQPPYYRGK